MSCWVLYKQIGREVHCPNELPAEEDSHRGEEEHSIQTQLSEKLLARFLMWRVFAMHLPFLGTGSHSKTDNFAVIPGLL